MLDVLKAIKKVIERFIVNMIPLRAVANAGDTIISVQTARRFCPGEAVVIYNKPSAKVQAEGEVHIIKNFIDNKTLELETPIVASFPLANSFMEKLIGFETGNEQFLEAVYIGDPTVIPRYPAITINANSRSSEWLTLESTSETYDIDISVYVQASDFESQYELMHAYVKGIEDSLFRSFYPLVEPFDKTTLAEATTASDTTIKIVDDDFFNCHKLGWVWFESFDFLRSNTLKRFLGSGVYELMLPVGADFAAGDSVIRPHRHIYNTLPHSTKYGTVNKDTMLKAAVISYKCSEEVRRFTPFIDPLSF